MTRNQLIASCLQCVPEEERKTVLFLLHTIGLPDVLYFVAREAFLYKVPESEHTERVRTALRQLLDGGCFTLEEEA